MIALPADKPVTVPAAVTLTMDELLPDQVPPARLSVMMPAVPVQMNDGPLIAGTLGAAITRTGCVATTSPQELLRM